MNVESKKWIEAHLIAFCVNFPKILTTKDASCFNSCLNHCLRIRIVTSGSLRDRIILSPRRGKDNSPLAETEFDFGMSDVLVDHSTYAPFLY